MIEMTCAELAHVIFMPRMDRVDVLADTSLGRPTEMTPESRHARVTRV